MFRIGEFSKLVRVSARMLRYYEKNGLFSPAEVDRFTGYRLYSAKQIPLLMKIVALRDMGFTVDEMEEILPYYEDESFMRQALDQKRTQILEVVEQEKIKLENLESFAQNFSRGVSMVFYEVEIKEIPAVQVLSLREVISSFAEEFGQWDKLVSFVKAHDVDVIMNGHSIYHDAEHKESDVDIEVAFPVKVMGESKEGFVFKELAAIPVCATIKFPLPYTNYNKAMQMIAMWLEENGYEICGLIRGVGTGEEFVELQIPVKSKE